MRHALLSAALLALAACGGSSAPAEAVTDDVGADAAEVISAADADAEAEADVKADRASLTAAQASTVLKSIDDTCGDTWCEGEYNYNFKRISCDFGAKRCTLSADVITYDTPPKKFPRACRMTGISSYAAMVQTTGGYASLTTRFFDKVSTCIDKWSPTIPAP